MRRPRAFSARTHSCSHRMAVSSSGRCRVPADYAATCDAMELSTRHRSDGLSVCLPDSGVPPCLESSRPELPLPPIVRERRLGDHWETSTSGPRHSDFARHVSLRCHLRGSPRLLTDSVMRPPRTFNLDTTVSLLTLAACAGDPQFEDCEPSHAPEPVTNQSRSTEGRRRARPVAEAVPRRSR